MKIRDIRIDGFGQFAGTQFGPLERSVTVSTVPTRRARARCWRSSGRVLFRISPQERKVNAYPALAGGSYGGHITIEGSDGGVYDVRRTTGKSYGGAVVLSLATGDTLPESELAKLLGHHSRDVFERVFRVYS